jgi:uncharacterized protein (TIGR01244 family)
VTIRTSLWRRARIALLALFVPIAAAGGYYAKWEFVDHRLVTISPGAVFQSAAFPAASLVEVVEQHGIKTVIDLRDDHLDLVAAEREALSKSGHVHVHVPMPLAMRPTDVDAFLASMAKAEKPVLVHCTHGTGRSVTMCAIHRIENEGWTNAAAFAGTVRLPDGLRFVSALWPSLCRFGADTDKGRMVLDYQPKSPRKPAAAAR